MHDLYHIKYPHFGSKICKCKDTVDRLVGNYGLLEYTLSTMAEKKDHFNSYFVNGKWCKTRYNPVNYTPCVRISNPDVVFLACEHIVNDIECYMDLHRLKIRKFEVPGDLQVSSFPLLGRLRNQFCNDEAESKLCSQEGLYFDACKKELNEDVKFNINKYFSNKVIPGLRLSEDDLLSKLKINETGKLQKLLLCPGPVLNLSAVIASKFQGAWRPYRDIVKNYQQPKIAELKSFVAILVQKGACKIRLCSCFQVFYIINLFLFVIRSSRIKGCKYVMVKHPIEDIYDMKEGKPTSIQNALASLNIPIELYVERYKMPLEMKRRPPPLPQQNVRVWNENTYSVQVKKHKGEQEKWPKEFIYWCKKEEKFYHDEDYADCGFDIEPEQEAWLRNSVWCVSVSADQYKKVLTGLSWLYKQRKIAEKNFINKHADENDESLLNYRILRGHFQELKKRIEEYMKFSERVDESKIKTNLFSNFNSLKDLLHVESTAMDFMDTEANITLKKCHDII